MKRKLFSALLFGACLMASTSTFVSCKDYDDDIQNLQAQIDANSKAIAEIQKLIQSGSVITNVSSTANGVTVTLSNGNTFNVTNGKDGANGKDGVDGANGKDGAPGTVITLGDNGNWFIDGKDSGLAAQGPKGDQGAPGANAAVNGEWYALSADCKKLEYYKDGVKDESKSIVIADLVKNAGVVNAVLTDDYLVFNGVAGSEEPIVISLSTDITAISLWMTGDEVYWADRTNDNLTFTSVEEKENTFPAVAGTVNEDPFTFTNGFLRTTDAKMVIRVSPANATVKAENIMLMDSQGKDLSDLIECTAVEPYKKLLVRSTGNPTGLYTLTFKLKDDYDADALKAAMLTADDDEILYAVAAKDGDDCLVASEWNVTLTTATSSPAWAFTVKVGDNKAKPVAEIHNRYSACEDGTNTTGIEEMVWKDANKPAVAPITEGTEANVILRGDDRQGKDILPVQVGQNIEIEFPETGNELVKGFYVALDYKYALESKPSELAAWNSYSYEGVTKINADGSVAEKGTLFTGNKGTIKITNMTQGIYDVIGFRVFAVNLDGTLSDPDGRSFYVGVGEAAENVTLNVDIVATATNAESDYIPVDGVFVDGLYGTVSDVLTTPTGDNAWTPSTVAGEWTKTKNLTSGNIVNPATIGIKLYEKNDGNDAGKALNDRTIDWSKIKYAKFFMNPSYTYYNGATYVQSIKVSKVVNKVQYEVKTITARITKVMPSFPAGKPAFRDAQEYAPGKFRAYMEPEPVGTEYAVAKATYKPYTLWSSSASSFSLSNGWLDDYSEKGTKDLNNVFYNLDKNYIFSLGTSDGANDDQPVEVKEGGTAGTPGVYKYPFTIATKYIDNEKEHVVTVTYKYPGVNCYKDDNNNWIVDKDGTTPANVYKATSSTTYSVIYACWHHAQTWDWATVDKTYKKPKLQWKAEGNTVTVNAVDIQGKSSYNNDFFGLDLNTIVWTYGMLRPGTIKLVSAAGLDNPYFAPKFVDNTATGNVTIEFTQTNTQIESAPVSDHEETLVMTFTDKYKHTVTIQLPVTVKKPATA